MTTYAKFFRDHAVVREWARRHAKGITVRERVQCLLDALRSLTRHFDPAAECLLNTSVMLTRNTRGDVDDVAVSLAAACESLGMRTKTVMVPTSWGWTVHVHVQDEHGEWTAYDPDSLCALR